MNIHPASQLSNYLSSASTPVAAQADPTQVPAELNENTISPDDAKVKDVFTQFVGETFFTQLIKSMRSSLGKPAYFHGGRAEEVFQGQLDQLLSERFAESSADQIAEPMYELFRLNRRA